MNNSVNKYIKKPDLKAICFIGIMTALEIILERLIPIYNSGFLKINLAFLPMALTAFLYGPLYCGLAWGITDLIGALLFPTGIYFPGFTLNQFLYGVVFGFLLFKFYLKEYSTAKKISVILLTVLSSNLIIGLGIGTFWLSILFGKGYFSLLPLRISGISIMSLIETVTIYTTAEILRKNKNFLKRFMK